MKIAALLLAVAPVLWGSSISWKCQECPDGAECWTTVRRTIVGTQTFQEVFSTRGHVSVESVKVGGVWVSTVKPMCDFRKHDAKPFPLANVTYEYQLRHCRKLPGLMEACGEYGERVP